ncbi:MAG: Wzz/FepE/Etk N-terminal domain-containing protein [Chloroflexi bacterium]|nr:Wzz/FepE/Etk N-terminal domain-containing protein [Chloroflexota bacterium]
MELKTYLSIIVAKWWIVVPVFLVTLAATSAFTFLQQPTWESIATYVVKPRMVNPEGRNSLSALGVLASPEVVGTFVEVANSRQIKGQAVSQLQLSREQVLQMSMNARKIPGTNVIEITVQAPDPALARDFASVVGAKTTVYVLGLYDAYELQQVDAPILAESPVRPKKVLNLSLGALTGLLLASCLAFTIHYLQSPVRDEPSLHTAGFGAEAVE